MLASQRADPTADYNRKWWLATGVKTEAAFRKQAALVSLVSDGKMLTLTQHRNGGATGNDKGFAAIDERKVRATVMLPLERSFRQL
jgi:hypothetical protein